MGNFGMKKFVSYQALFLIICMCMAGCGKAVSTADEMLEIMQQEGEISADLRECGTLVNGDTLLLVASTEADERVSTYCAAEFSITEEGKYRFEEMVDPDMYKLGWQMGMCKWKQGYALVSCNKDAKKLRLGIKESGEPEREMFVEIESIPWVYYLDMSESKAGYDINYTFLDSEGREVR